MSRNSSFSVSSVLGYRFPLPFYSWRNTDAFSRFHLGEIQALFLVQFLAGAASARMADIIPGSTLAA